MKHLIKISLLIFFLLHVEAECDDARFVQANVNDRTVDMSTIIVTGLFWIVLDKKPQKSAEHVLPAVCH